VGDNETRMLLKAVLDYSEWVKTMEAHRGTLSSLRYTQSLMDLLIFTIDNGIAWKDIFTLETLEAFKKYSRFKQASQALIALSRFLFSHGQIDRPIEIPRPKTLLPDIYENYLLYQKQRFLVSDGHSHNVRKVLSVFHDYLEREQLQLSALKIEHLDAFMAEFKVAPVTRRLYRYCLRGFLKYLYQEQKILRKDLAPLLVGPPHVGQVKPPKFLRPGEVKNLFATLKLATPVDIRTYAIVHLAYTLGLRPIEITRITLDDLTFSKGELTLRQRKADNPITLPIAKNTLKAVSAYVLKARPKSPYRHLFLSFQPPFKPLSSYAVTLYISRTMKQAGLSSTSYWLRHTYAQNLLEMGRSIYEIKEMMGHQNIQTTRVYLHIDTKLMRKVLFDEELP